MGGIELSIPERIRKLGEKETYKCLGIFEADIIKQVEMKEIKKRKKWVSLTNDKKREPGRPQIENQRERKERQLLRPC